MRRSLEGSTTNDRSTAGKRDNLAWGLVPTANRLLWPLSTLGARTSNRPAASESSRRRTSDLKKLVGVVQPGDGQKAIAFHPVLSVGGVCTWGHLVLFNSKSKILANIEKIALPGFDAGSDTPVYVDFGALGTKAIICPLGEPYTTLKDVTLRFVPLTLSEEDTNVLKKAYGGTSELKNVPRR
jgi:hypothetical protein